MNKSDVTCQVYTDNKLTKSILEKRVIYTNKKGRYIRSMGNKYYLNDSNAWKNEYFTLPIKLG